MKNSSNKSVVIGIPCLLRGGTEMQTLLLARVLVELGYHVDVLCYFESDDKVIVDFKAVGAKVIRLNWSRSTGFIKFIQSFSSIIREKKPDVVHPQYIAPGLLPIIAARLARPPVILATVHYPGTPHGILAHSFLRFGASMTQNFTCVSEAAEKSWFGDAFLLNPAQPTRVKGMRHCTIPNAVDVAQLDKALAAYLSKFSEVADALKDKAVVGTVARLMPEKGVDILVKAFAVVKKIMPDALLLIVGEGNQTIHLKNLAGQLKINDAVIWMGKLSWQEAMGCMNMMDVVVVPSRFEGFGLTAAEAMACGKPVVASRVDGLAEIIRDGVTGFLVNSEDVKGFADKIAALLQDETQRKKIGQAARKHIEDNYSYPIFRERVKVLYNSF